jgi:predicted dehydrogenase
VVRLAIIGTGGMANAHASAFAEIEGCEVVTCSDIVPGRAKEFADRHGIASAYESTEEMLAKEKLDGVSVVTPDQHHMQPVLMAIDKGLHVMCEKPLASSLADAKRMAEAAKAKGVLTAMNFSYRNSPATQKAAEMVASGAIGRVIHVEGAYLQCWIAAKIWGDWRTSEALLWRMSTRHGSLGVLGDVGVHMYDLVSFIAGDIEEISCDLRTFKKDLDKKDDYVFDANESAVMNVRFANGALGTLHTSRWATGHANTVSASVYGDKGAIDLNLDRPAPETLKACLGDNVDKAVWENVDCPDTPNMYRRFVDSIREGRQGQTSFEGGVKVQAYLDASMASAESGRYVKTNVA